MRFSIRIVRPITYDWSYHNAIIGCLPVPLLMFQFLKPFQNIKILFKKDSSVVLKPGHNTAIMTNVSWLKRPFHFLFAKYYNLYLKSRSIS